MSFYSSNSYFNNSSSYYNNLGHSFNNSSNYNDMHRSYSNLRALPTIQHQLFISTTPYSYITKPQLNKYDKENNGSKYNLTTNEHEIETKTVTTTTTTFAPSKVVCYEDKNRTEMLPKHKEKSYETYSRSSSNLNFNDTKNVIVPISKVSSFSSSNSNFGSESFNKDNSMYSISSQTQRAPVVQEIKIENPMSTSTSSIQLNHESNDVISSAVSNIQLNCTDDLTTQVDYYLNEIDNRMICRGKQIELESFELSGKSGLITKCLYLNDLLKHANMSEINLETDPIFSSNGRAILLFTSAKDSEEFANRHSEKFNIVFSNNASEEFDNKNKNQKKNVSFIEDTSNNSYLNENDLHKKKSIIKSSANSLSSSDSAYNSNDHLIRSSSLSSPKTNEQLATNSNSNILVSANTLKKSKAEGYEILTIKAKLKQRVGQNRTKQVELRDIDSIMRNVVTIIQDEFMKRFPSGPSAAALRSS